MNKWIYSLIAVWMLCSCTARTAEDWLRHASQAFLETDYQKTLQIVNDALQSKTVFSDKQNYILRGLRAQSQTHLKRYEESYAELSDIISQNPKSSPFYYCQAHNNYFMGQYEESVKNFSMAIVYNQDWNYYEHITLSKTFYYRGLCFMKMGDVKSAFRDFIRAERLGFKKALERISEMENQVL